MNRPNLRRAAALVAVPATIALFAAPAAWAQDATGPDSEACVAAEQAITHSGLETQISIFTDGPPGTSSLAMLQSDADNAIAAAGDAGTPASKVTQAELERLQAIAGDEAHPNKTAAEKKIPTLQTALSAVAALDVRVGLIADTQEKLDVLVADRDTACAEPNPEPDPTVDPEPTDEPDPTVTDEPDPTSTQPAPDSTEPAASSTDDVTAVEDDATLDAFEYENCAAARAAGAAPVYATDYGFHAGLDANHNGIGCEDDDGNTLYNPVTVGENPADYSQVGEVPRGSAETGQA